MPRFTSREPCAASPVSTERNGAGIVCAAIFSFAAVSFAGGMLLFASASSETVSAV